jgi:phage gpG-like protein
VATIVIRGDKQVLEQIRTWPNALESVLLQVGALYEREVKKSLSLAGPFFRVFGHPGMMGKRREGQWTERNQSPFLRVGTGELRSSITHSLAQSSPNTYEVRVGTNVVYARIHELGAAPGQWKAWGRSARTAFPARPYMRPVTESGEVQLRVAGVIGTKLVAHLDLGRGGAT